MCEHSHLISAWLIECIFCFITRFDMIPIRCSACLLQVTIRTNPRRSFGRAVAGGAKISTAETQLLNDVFSAFLDFVLHADRCRLAWRARLTGVGAQETQEAVAPAQRQAGAISKPSLRRGST